MKTIIATAIAMVLAGSASADLLFGLGANMFTTHNSGSQAAAGQNFSVLWVSGEGLALGVYFERSGLEGGGYDSQDGYPDSITVNSVQISKSVLRNVGIVGRIGAGRVLLDNSGSPTIVTAPNFEFGGEVTIVTASGEKVTGKVVALIVARFCNPSPNPRADGANAGLVIVVEF
jgi:hypothetical protein